MATLIVVTHQSRSHLPGLAASLPAGLAGVAEWQLVVVDNASTDGTREVAEHLWPDAVVLDTGRNAGYAAAINEGLRKAPPGPVLVLNPDLRLRPASVARLLAALESPGIGVAAPRLIEPDGSTSWSARREPSVARVWAESLLGGDRAARWGLGEIVATGYDRERDVDWATGAVLAISAQCREVVGEWDESFWLYSEEVDFCRRARASGQRVRHVPSAVVEHVGGAYDGDARLWQVLVANRVRDFARHHSGLVTALFRWGLLVGEMLRSTGDRGDAHRAGARAVLRPEATLAEIAPARVTPAAEGTEPGFIWFAAQDWWYHNQAHSDFQLMREVARTRPVLVVNSLGLRVPSPGNSTHVARRILRKLRSTAKLVRRPVAELPGFHVMSPILLPFYGDNAGARLNAWLVRQQVRAVARRLGLDEAPHIGVTIPTAWPVVRGMKRRSLVFNRSDLHSAFPEADGQWVAGLEHSLLVHGDAVLYVSRELMEKDSPVVGGRAVFLDHGVDFTHFSPEGEVDPEVAAIPGPRIGFFGGLDDYVVDFDLLRETATALPDASLVLVGDATCPMDELTALPNVHWLGFRPYASIPAIGRGFDVALMPWLDNEWIRFANPIKLKEYLALGLPVVTTDYPEVEDYRDRVQVAVDRSQFPDLVRRALGQRADSRALRESVRSASWTTRAGHLVEVADRIGIV